MAIYTQDQYKALTDAIAMGALKVKYADKEVEYRSIGDMIRIKDLMEKDLFPTQKKTGNMVLSSYSKGV